MVAIDERMSTAWARVVRGVISRLKEIMPDPASCFTSAVLVKGFSMETRIFPAGILHSSGGLIFRTMSEFSIIYSLVWMAAPASTYSTLLAQEEVPASDSISTVTFFLTRNGICSGKRATLFSLPPSRRTPIVISKKFYYPLLNVWNISSHNGNCAWIEYNNFNPEEFINSSRI